MTKLVSLLGRKSSAAVQAPVSPATTRPANSEAAKNQPIKTDIELDHELFLPIASQLGHENEAVRNLLIDAEHKLGELETIRHTIGRLVDPVAKTLRAYEEAKSEKLSLQSVLNNTRIAHAKLRDDHDAMQKKAASLDAETVRLREVTNIAQQSAAALEKIKAEQAAEIASRGNHIAELQQHVQQLGTDMQKIRTDNARLTERAAAADRRAVQSDGDAQAAQQKAMQSAQEQMALQTALDKAHAELAQVARRLTETDKTLKATQARLATAETSLADAQAERLRLSAALDESSHRHSDSTTAMSAKFEALQARAAMTEKLLEEARTALVARADEIRTFERRVHDTASAHSNADDRIAEVTATLAEREAQIRDLEHAHATVSQHNEMLAGHVDAHKTSSENALEKIREQAELLQLLESQLKTMREAHALQIEQLNAQLQREQLERTMAEGALAAGRKDIAQMLRQIQALQHRPNPMAAPAEMPAAPARVRSAA